MAWRNSSTLRRRWLPHATESPKVRFSQGCVEDGLVLLPLDAPEAVHATHVVDAVHVTRPRGALCNVAAILSRSGRRRSTWTAQGARALVCVDGSVEVTTESGLVPKAGIRTPTPLPAVFDRDVAPELRSGSAVAFGSGSCPAFGLVQ